MSKKKNKSSSSDNSGKTESYIIKVPVHLAFMYEEKDSLFFSNKLEMIQFVKDKIDNYKNPVKVKARNKTKTTVISAIRYEEIKIGDTPALLLTIGAFDTNVSGKYLEGDAVKKVDITPNHKIGSDNNLFLLYPVIKGLSDTCHVCSFLLLSYETPLKDGAEMSKLARLFISKVLTFSGANLKPPHIIDEIKQVKNFQEVLLRFTSIVHDENDVDMELREFYTGGTSKSSSIKRFQNIPAQIIFDLLDRNKIELDGNNYITQEASFIIGKQTYKLRKEIADDIAEIQESAEKIFNASVAISKKDLESRLDDKSFIIEKFSSVLTNYLSYGHGL